MKKASYLCCIRRTSFETLFEKLNLYLISLISDLANSILPQHYKTDLQHETNQHRPSINITLFAIHRKRSITCFNGSIFFLHFIQHIGQCQITGAFQYQDFVFFVVGGYGIVRKPAFKFGFHDLLSLKVNIIVQCLLRNELSTPLFQDYRHILLDFHQNTSNILYQKKLTL